MSIMLQKDSPLVSIIVRTKDRPVLLRRALQSIAEQTYRPIEVVLVNDGGCDLDIDQLKGINGNITLNYIRLEKNKGRSYAGNVGIENAKGKYVGFLDDDDEIYSDHIMVLVSFLERSDCEIAYTDSYMVHQEYNPATCDRCDVRREVVFARDFDYSILVFENYIPLLCLLFTKSILTESSGFDTALDLYEDWDLLIRIGEKYHFSHIRKITAQYNQWDIDLQISQKFNNTDFLKLSYIGVLSKHFDKITPQRVHDYMNNSINLKQTQYELEKLRTELEDKKSHIEVLKKLADERYDLITAMRNTRGWRILERYRKLRDSITARSCNQERESLIRKGFKVLKHQGFKAFIQKTNKKLLFYKSIKTTYKPASSTLKINTIHQAVIERSIQSKVSVIIPTQNAGSEFDYILRKIVQQEGIREIELIIVDSGSTDGTLDICRSYTRNIFQVTSGNFHHARTRNFAAGKATGNYLVFTVQDAIPVGNQWLYKLITPLNQGIVSAVSTRQIPRSDADIFASWSYWGHNVTYLGGDQDRFSDHSVENFDKLDIQTKRSIAGLDNVCLGITSKIFDTYQFKTDYAEDLELGVRLLKDGHSLMFQSSNGVIHSHNRPPMYFFKRSYVNAITILNILKIERNNLPVDNVLEVISYFYYAFKKSLDILNQEQYSGNPSSLIHSLLSILDDTLTSFDHTWQLVKGDLHCDEYFSTIPPMNHQKIVPEMYSVLAEELKGFSHYMRSYPSIATIRDDFAGSLYKLFCNTLGNYLGSNTHENIYVLCEGI